MNSNMVKPEKFDHLHLVYHFTVPLRLAINPVILLPFIGPQASLKAILKPSVVTLK